MRVASIAFALLLTAGSAAAADAVYLDQLVETPLAQLQTQFDGLKKEDCYRIAADRWVMISIDKKDQKPWRIVLGSVEPCKHSHDGPSIDIRERRGVEIGDAVGVVVQKMGAPDTASNADASMRKFGDMEYFYICRVEEGCARHTSIFLKGGVVTAIAEWYSE